MYRYKTSEFFKNISVTFSQTKPKNYKKKIQALLTDIVWKLYSIKLNAKTPPFKNPSLWKKRSV